MSFSNADTGSKPADPYTAKNKDEVSLKEKVEDLIHFADKQKFCLLTTITPEGQVATRCMALAGKVSLTNDISTMMCRASQVSLGDLNLTGNIASTGKQWHRLHLPHQHRVRQDR
jgi:hypothetical protein